jgi:exosortase
VKVFSTHRSGKTAQRQRNAGRNVCLFSLCCAASLLVWWRPILHTYQLAIHRDAYTQILLILPITTALLLANARKSAWMPVVDVPWGFSVMVASIAIAIAGLESDRLGLSGDVRLTIEMFAAVLWWMGSFLLCFGPQVFRRCVFPLFFLLWMVPLPQVAVDQLIEILQRGTVSLTYLMFTLFGIPAQQHGTMLSMPGLTVEVTSECSSIRSSLMLIVTATVTSYTFLRSTWGRTVGMLASFPLAVAKNALRVFIITTLSAFMTPQIMNSRLHRQGGPLFLGVAIAVLLGLIWIIRRVELRFSGRHRVAGMNWREEKSEQFPGPVVASAERI